MNGNPQNLLSFVGAMKIARNPPVYERHVEWYPPLPAPSLRELLSAAKLRECTSMNVTAQKFQSLYALVSKPSAWSNHRTTLPQSRIRSTAPSEREPGMGCAIHRTARKPGGCGRFSSPLRNSEMGTLYHSSRCLPIRSFAFIVFNQRNGRGDGRRPLGGYCSTSNLYPTPQTVFRFHLSLTPSSFSRRRFTWTSTVRESPK